MKSCWLVACLTVGSCCLPALAYDRVHPEVAKALGTTRGRSIATGLVFIDGKYVKPPYRVTRLGNQILVNDHPVTGQLVPWEKFVDTQPQSVQKELLIEEPVRPSKPDRSSEPPAEKDGVDPAAPKDGGVPSPSSALDDLFSGMHVVIEESRYAADADDLDDFNPKNAPDKMKLTDIPPDSEADRARQKKVEDERKEEAEEEAKDEGEGKVEGEGERRTDNPSAGENEEAVDPASPEGEAAAKRAAAKAQPPTPVVRKTRKVTTLAGRFEMNFRAQKLLKPIDAYRSKLESTLRRGGYLFFGTGAKRYCVGRTSDAIATSELLKKLPELMARADDSEGFCDAVRSAGLFSYVNLQIAQDLYRHKMDSIFLKQRRREIAEQDKLNRMINNGR